MFVIDCFHQAKPGTSTSIKYIRLVGEIPYFCHSQNLFHALRAAHLPFKCTGKALTHVGAPYAYWISMPASKYLYIAGLAGKGIRNYKCIFVALFSLISLCQLSTINRTPGEL